MNTLNFPFSPSLISPPLISQAPLSPLSSAEPSTYGTQPISPQVYPVAVVTCPTNVKITAVASPRFRRRPSSTIATTSVLRSRNVSPDTAQGSVKRTFFKGENSQENCDPNLFFQLSKTKRSRPVLSPAEKRDFLFEASNNFLESYHTMTHTLEQVFKSLNPKIIPPKCFNQWMFQESNPQLQQIDKLKSEFIQQIERDLGVTEESIVISTFIKECLLFPKGLGYLLTTPLVSDLKQCCDTWVNQTEVLASLDFSLVTLRKRVLWLKEQWYGEADQTHRLLRDLSSPQHLGGAQREQLMDYKEQKTLFMQQLLSFFMRLGKPPEIYDQLKYLLVCDQLFQTDYTSLLIKIMEGEIADEQIQETLAVALQSILPKKGALPPQQMSFHEPAVKSYRTNLEEILDAYRSLCQKGGFERLCEGSTPPCRQTNPFYLRARDFETPENTRKGDFEAFEALKRRDLELRREFAIALTTYILGHSFHLDFQVPPFPPEEGKNPIHLLTLKDYAFRYDYSALLEKLKYLRQADFEEELRKAIFEVTNYLYI